MNKIFIIDISEGLKYVLSSEYNSIIQGSVENSPSYVFDRFLSFPWALNVLEFKYTRVVNMPWFCVNCILKILNIECLSSEYAKVLNVSGVQIYYAWGFWIKYFIVYIWQGSEYITVSKYDRIVNILWFWICQVSLRKCYIIYMLGRVLNIPQALHIPEF